jgi:hypothetical protein
VLRLIGVEFKILEEILNLQFKRKGEAVVAENVGVARAGYDYAAAQFKPLPITLPDTGKKLAFFEGNQALAMGGAAAGVRFYCAYPMSPASGVLHWMARTHTSWALWCARWKMRSASSIWRSARPMPAAGPCARPPVAVLR